MADPVQLELFDKPTTELDMGRSRAEKYQDPSQKAWVDPALPKIPKVSSVVDKPDSPALAIQMGGDHYKRMGAYQPWEVLARWLNKEQYQGYLLGTALAYLGRFNTVEEKGHKGGMLDVKKGMHTLQRLIETEDM